MPTEERETKTFETPDGVKVEVKTYLTGREMRAIKDTFLRHMKIKGEGDKSSFEGLQGSVTSEAEDKTIETSVVSVNGSKEGILNTILDLPAKEYNFIVKELNKLVFTDVKKKS